MPLEVGECIDLQWGIPVRTIPAIRPSIKGLRSSGKRAPTNSSAAVISASVAPRPRARPSAASATERANQEGLCPFAWSKPIGQAAVGGSSPLVGEARAVATEHLR